MKRLETLWFNAGTLCNLAWRICCIQSSPTNDRLAYLTRGEARAFLAEACRLSTPPVEIGFAGGEPFLNPDLIAMLEDSLVAGFRVLVLTNAMKPLMRRKEHFHELQQRFHGRLSLRVSLDHYDAAGHERLRGPRSWEPALVGLLWLARNGFDLSIAVRASWGETEGTMRAGYAELFGVLGLDIDAEIMCSSSRMVIKRKGAAAPVVVACTLPPYAGGFEMGASLAEAAGPVALNHRHCARFRVLGGATCSAQR